MNESNIVTDFSEIANSLREELGLSPEEIEENYDSMVDMVCKKYGEPASDELFEQAVEIYTRRCNELLASGEGYYIIDEDEETDPVKINRPKRKRKE